jgi:hypothetical protein
MITTEYLKAEFSVSTEGQAPDKLWKDYTRAALTDNQLELDVHGQVLLAAQIISIDKYMGGV